MALYVLQSGIRVATTMSALAAGIALPTIGMVLATYAVLPMFLSVPIGRWIDRSMVRTPLMLGSALALAGASGPVLVGGVPGLLVAAVLVGLGYSVVNIAGQHAVGRLSVPERRRDNFNHLSLALASASLVGPLLVGLLIDHASHRAAFAALAACAAAALAACAAAALAVTPWAFRHERPADRAARAGSGMSVAGRPHAVFRLLLERRLWPVFLVGAVISCGWDLFTFYVPLHGDRLGLSAARTGAILSAFAAASMLVRFGMPWISRHLNAWRILGIALALASISFVLFPLLSQYLLLVGIAVVLGLAFGSTQANMLVLLHQHSQPARVAEAIGIRMTLGGMAQVLTPVLMSSFGAVAGFASVFGVMAGLCALSAYLAWSEGARTAHAAADAN